MFRIFHYNKVLTTFFIKSKKKISGFLEDVLKYNCSGDDDFWSLDADSKDVDKQYIIRKHLDDL